MSVDYTGWSKRIDLRLREKYPLIKTKIYKISDFKYEIWVQNYLSDFESLSKEFDYSIRYITAPIELVEQPPAYFENEISGIGDNNVSSNLEGFSLTETQLLTHINSNYPDLSVSSFGYDRKNAITNVTLNGEVTGHQKIQLEEALNKLKQPFSFQVASGGEGIKEENVVDSVFAIGSAKSMGRLNCEFLRRDEELWFNNIEGIYSGSYDKDDLFFYDSNKTSCLVNFSIFSNANLRNHLLLYDVVYCVLPLSDRMSAFLEDQKITRDEIVSLAKIGRIKILNMQPEHRLDYGFLNEIFQEAPNSIVSRRGLSSLCAIDIVSMNNSYIFSDPSFSDLLLPLAVELSKLFKKPVGQISRMLLWPAIALRASASVLNISGPKAIANYGVNNQIVEGINLPDKKQLEFEFTVSSSNIHLAHALDATYFPFFTKEEQYTDHPYTLMMGNLLNFYKSFQYPSLREFQEYRVGKINRNKSIDLISIFDVSEYIPVEEFIDEVSSSVVRSGLNTLFNELKIMDAEERGSRIAEYNSGVEEALKNKKVVNATLDLGEDTVGLVLPFIGTGKKVFKWGVRRLLRKYPAIEEVNNIVESKVQSSNDKKRTISLLSRINRVARLKKIYR